MIGRHRGLWAKAAVGLGLGLAVGLLLRAAPTVQHDDLANVPEAHTVALAPPAKAGFKLRLPTPAAMPPVGAEADWPQVAIVIDDLGLNHALTLRTIALDGPLTLSFLPYGHGLGPLAARARAGGHELFVHLPMQPKEAARDPGPRALRVGMAPAALAGHVDWHLSRFDGFVGVNNHMGSRFTEDDTGMAQLFDILKARGLMFIDSRTTARSAGAWLAARQGLSYGERDVFLDNERAAPALALQLAQLERRARDQGTAIAIGHPHPVTIAALERWIASLPAKKLRLVPVSAIIAVRGSPLWRLAHDKGVSINQLAPGSK